MWSTMNAAHVALLVLSITQTVRAQAQEWGMYIVRPPWYFSNLHLICIGQCGGIGWTGATSMWFLQASLWHAD